MPRNVWLAGCLCALLASGTRLDAQTTSDTLDASAVSVPATTFSFVLQESTTGQPPSKKPSPWLLLPMVTSGPKMGTSFGFIGAWLHYFDPKSQVSMFGLMYQYSSTKSQVAALFARTSFAQDRQRVVGIYAYADIKNEYKDYQGTGQTFRTTDTFNLGAGRYLYRVKGPWFIGGEAVFGDYSVTGDTQMEQKILNLLGLTGFHAGAIGPVLQHDSRDNQDMPTTGWYSNLHYLADRTWLGGQQDFDTLRLDLKGFIEHGDGHVFAVRVNNQWTHDAPTSAQSTIELRGYKVEQYLAKYMSSAEAEERIRFSKRWGATLFGGVAALYGPLSDQFLDSNGWYPSYGAGIHYVVKPEDHMLLNCEFAHGNLNNYGVYLQFGYSW